MKKFHSAIVLLTDQCNMKCPYCFENRSPKRMNLSTAIDIIEFLIKDSPFAHLCFFGGEPLLEYDTLIVPMIEYIKSHNYNFSFSMTTNGSLLDEEKIQYLINNKVNYMISMDGRKQTQNFNRPLKNNQDSFDTVYTNLKLSQKYYANVPVHITIIPDSIKYLYDDIIFFENEGVTNLSIQPDTSQIWSKEQHMIFEDCLNKYQNHIVNSIKIGKSPLIIDNISRAYQKLKNLADSTGHRTCIKCSKENQCGFANHGNCDIDTQGNIYTCHRITPLVPESQWCIGNIYDGVDIQKQQELLNSWDVKQVGNDLCQECPLDDICTGCCVSDSFVIYNNITKVPYTFCFFERGISDLTYNLIRELKYSDLFGETDA